MSGIKPSSVTSGSTDSFQQLQVNVGCNGSGMHSTSDEPTQQVLFMLLTPYELNSSCNAALQPTSIRCSAADQHQMFCIVHSVTRGATVLNASGRISYRWNHTRNNLKVSAKSIEE